MTVRFGVRRASVAAAALLWMLLAASSAAQRASQTPQPDDYAVRVRRAAALAENAASFAEDAGTHREVDRDLAMIGRLLPRAERVEFAGREVDVDNRRLEGMIAAAKAVDSGARKRRAVERVTARLRMIDDALGGPAPIAGNRRLLRRVAAESAGTGPSYLSQMTAKIAAWLRRTLGKRFDLSPALTERAIPSPPQWLLVAAALIIIGVASLLMLRLVLRRVRVGRVGAPDVAFTPISDLPDEDEYELAVQRARAGDRREAVRLLFRSLQFRLNMMRVVLFKRAQTNFEYLDAVRDAGPAMEPHVRSMIGTFERTQYGLRDCAAGEFEQYSGEYESVVQEARKLGGGPR